MENILYKERKITLIVRNRFYVAWLCMILFRNKYATGVRSITTKSKDHTESSKCHDKRGF